MRSSRWTCSVITTTSKNAGAALHGPRLDGEAERGTAMGAIAFLLICFSATDHEVVASYFIYSETACDNARGRHASGGRMHGGSVRAARSALDGFIRSGLL